MSKLKLGDAVHAKKHQGIRKMYREGGLVFDGEEKKRSPKGKASLIAVEMVAKSSKKAKGKALKKMLHEAEKVIPSLTGKFKKGAGIQKHKAGDVVTAPVKREKHGWGDMVGQGFNQGLNIATNPIGYLAQMAPQMLQNPALINSLVQAPLRPGMGGAGPGFKKGGKVRENHSWGDMVGGAQNLIEAAGRQAPYAAQQLGNLAGKIGNPYEAYQNALQGLQNIYNAPRPGQPVAPVAGASGPMVRKNFGQLARERRDDASRSAAFAQYADSSPKITYGMMHGFLPTPTPIQQARAFQGLSQPVPLPRKKGGKVRENHSWGDVAGNTLASALAGGIGGSFLPGGGTLAGAITGGLGTFLPGAWNELFGNKKGGVIKAKKGGLITQKSQKFAMGGVGKVRLGINEPGRRFKA